MTGNLSTLARHVAIASGFALVLASCSDDAGNAEPPSTTSTVASTTTTTAPATTTTSANATTSGSLPSPTGAELCESVVHRDDSPGVKSDLLTEISGIAASRQHDGLIWAHNDSGGQPLVHLLGPLGEDLGEWPLQGAEAVDWEDMAIGPAPDGGHYLYLADFGDNVSARSEIVVYRALEPSDIASSQPIPVDSFRFTYPGGARDAESLFVDPLDGDIYIVSKYLDLSPSEVYRADAAIEPGTTTELELVAEIEPTGLLPIATAATISADGTVILLRTYSDVLLWERDPAQSVATAMTGSPCRAPAVGEPQGEAITFLPDGSGYVTISEGSNPPINLFSLPD
jgi:hypothetical protein